MVPIYTRSCRAESLMTAVGSPRLQCKAPATDCDVVAGNFSGCAVSSSPLATLIGNNFNSSATSASNKTLSPANGGDSPTVDIIKGWRYRGCYTDIMTDRVLAGRRFRWFTLTVQRCAEVCKGYRYFGVEYSDEYVSFLHGDQCSRISSLFHRCYCGNTLSKQSKQVPDELCDRVCMADFRHYCGGSLKLGLYEAENSDIAIS